MKPKLEFYLWSFASLHDNMNILFDYSNNRINFDWWYSVKLPVCTLFFIFHNKIVLPPDEGVQFTCIFSAHKPYDTETVPIKIKWLSHACNKRRQVCDGSIYVCRALILARLFLNHLTSWSRTIFNPNLKFSGQYMGSKMAL